MRLINLDVLVIGVNETYTIIIKDKGVKVNPQILRNYIASAITSFNSSMFASPQSAPSGVANDPIIACIS